MESAVKANRTIFVYLNFLGKVIEPKLLPLSTQAVFPSVATCPVFSAAEAKMKFDSLKTAILVVFLMTHGVNEADYQGCIFLLLLPTKESKIIESNFQGHEFSSVLPDKISLT